MTTTLRRAVSAILVLLLLLTFSLSAAADSMDIVDSYADEAILSLCENDALRKEFNLFVSNFVEAGVTEYSLTTGDAKLIDFALKHLELNHSLYSGMELFTASSGKRAMKVSRNTVDRVLDKLMNRSVSHPAGGFSGYSDGYYYATAPDADSKITFAAVVSEVFYRANREYGFVCDIYSCSAGADRLYKYSQALVQQDSSCRYEGEIAGSFYANKDSDSYVFSLSWLTDTSDSYTVPSLEAPMPLNAQDMGIAQSLPVSQTTTSGTQTAEADTTLSEGTDNTKPDVQQDANALIQADSKPDTAKAGLSKIAKILIIVIIIALAFLVSTIVIVLIIRKKEKQ